MLNTIERSIITAMARALFIMAWADYHELLTGEGLTGEIDPQAPPTPPEVINVAHFMAGLITRSNAAEHHSLFMIFRRALAADKVTVAEWQEDPKVQKEFGHCLAMMITGQGVSWFDSHTKFHFNMPHQEWTHLHLAELCPQFTVPEVLKDEHGREYVIRWVVTHVGKDGYRVMSFARQGRHTFAAKQPAQDWIDSALKNNSPSTLKQAYGDVSKMEPRECRCYPNHFDPMQMYFEPEVPQVPK